MKRITKIGYLLTMSALVVLMLLTLSSCWLTEGDDEVIIAPQINPVSLPRVEKILADYTDYNANNERKIYSDNKSTMAVNKGDNVYFVVDLINKSGVTFNKAIISGGGVEKEIYAKDFDSSTTPTQLRIKWEITETTSGLSKYVIKKLYYNAGSLVNSLELYEDNVTFTLNVNPTFSLRINEQNGSNPASRQVTYKQSLEDVLSAVTNKADDTSCPRKVGGWVFKGYFTKPNGLGMQVKQEDIFYFWADTTLYAYYDRLYNFTVKTCKEYGIDPIEDVTVDPVTHLETPETYDKVAIITKKTTTGDLQNTLEIYDTIIDDEGNVLPIVEIGSGAFDNTVSLRRLVIGKFVMKICDRAFHRSNMTTITFAKDGRLTYIGDEAFYGTSKLALNQLTAMTLPETVTYLGDQCFYESGWSYSLARGDITARQTLSIYSNLTHIGDKCFVKTGFTAVEFYPGVLFRPDAVKGQNYQTGVDEDENPVYAPSDYYLGWCLFKNCHDLTTFNTRADDGVSNGLKYVSDGMFDILTMEDKSNAGLTRVSLAEGLIKIGKGAFHYQTKLKSITLPKSLEDICSDNSINGPNGKFPGDSNEKSEYGSFEDCTSLASVFFTEGSQLKVLGCNAFRNCRLLETIRFPSKVLEKFGDAPFQGCSLLTEVYFDFDNTIPIPTPITGYKRGALTARSDGADLFYPIMSFKVFVGENVVDEFRKQLKLHASSETKKNLQVFANEMVHELKDKSGTVYAKVALEEVTVGEISGWSMGYYSSTNTVVVVPDTYNNKNIIQIGAFAFSKQVESVTLGQFTMKISDFAFKECSKLETLHFGNEYKGTVNQEIGRNALQELGTEAFYGTAIRYFIGGTNLKTLGNEVFFSCLSLQFVDLKKCGNLKQLGTGVFNNCRGLEYVRLPENVDNIEDATFANNYELKAVVVESTTVGTSFFPKAIDTYFSGVGLNTVTVYTRSQSSCDAIANSKFLVEQLVRPGAILYSPNTFRALTPDPDEILPSLYCTDPDAQYGSM